MTRIPRNLKPKVLEPNFNKMVKKINPLRENSIKNPVLEKSPTRDFFYDYSTEINGYFTKREAKTGRILEVFQIMFPR